MEMSKEQAYQAIAKHIYVAYLTYSTSRKEIIVLADDDSEARKLALEYFQRSRITVRLVEPTKDKQIYEI